MNQATLEAAGRLLSTLELSSDARMSQREDGGTTTVVASTPRDSDRFDLSVGIYAPADTDETTPTADPSPAWLVLRYDGGSRLATRPLDARGRAIFRDLPRGRGAYSLAISRHLGRAAEPMRFASRPIALAASTGAAFDESEFFEIESYDGLLVGAVARYDAATLDVSVESRAPAEHVGAFVRCDLHDGDGVVSHSRLILLDDAHGIVDGRCRAPLPDYSPLVTFAAVEPTSIDAADAEMVVASYEATDPSGRRSWRERLRGDATLAEITAFRLVRDHVINKD